MRENRRDESNYSIRRVNIEPLYELITLRLSEIKYPAGHRETQNNLVVEIYIWIDLVAQLVEHYTFTNTL